MLVCVFMLPVFPFLFAIDKDGEAETHTLDELPLEERVFLKDVPADSVLRFRALRLGGVQEEPLCYAAPAGAPASKGDTWRPLEGSSCPDGVRHRRCAIWGRTELHGCVPWDGGRLGVDPAAAAELTIAVRDALDRLQADYEAEGRRVVRMDRYLVVLR